MGDTQRDGTVMGEGQQTRSPLLTGVAYPAAQDGSADCDTDGGGSATADASLSTKSSPLTADLPGIIPAHSGR